MDELDELRLRIAKAEGWILNPLYDPLHKWIEPAPLYRRIDPPNWPRDVAAAFELEDEIPESERLRYTDCLIRVIYGEAPLKGRIWDIAHATPEQRCRAYLAWKEAQG